MDNPFSKNDQELIDAFAKLSSKEGLASFLEMPLSKLSHELYGKKKSPKYWRFNIPKRSGGIREILAPNSTLKGLQRKIAYTLSLQYRVKAQVHGFAQGKSIVSNARSHVRRKYVLNVDLEDFFPSINFGRVRGMFLSKPFSFPKEVATYLAQLCCFENVLPQGAPTSPIVSNIICAKLDNEILEVCRRFRCSYTRYADDITVSSVDRFFNEALLETEYSEGTYYINVGSAITSIIENNGFKINTSKTRLLTRAMRQVVTGLVVNEKVNVKRKYLKNIRAILHAAEKYGVDAAQTEHLDKYYNRTIHPNILPPKLADIVEGKINFLKMVVSERDDRFKRFANLYNKVFGQRFDNYIINTTDIFPSVWVIESQEGEEIYQGTGFLLQDVGFVTCAHVLKDNPKAFRISNPQERYDVRLIKKEDAIDLAVCEIDFKENVGLKPIKKVDWEIGDKICVIGFPNQSLGDRTPCVEEGLVNQVSGLSGIDRANISGHIIRGMSGSPVFNAELEVVGVAVTGEDNLTKKTEDHAVIPIDALERF